MKINVVWKAGILAVLFPLIVIILVWFAEENLSIWQPKWYLFSVLPNLLLMRYYFIKTKNETAAKLVLLISFLLGVGILVFLNYYSVSLF